MRRAIRLGLSCTGAAILCLICQRIVAQGPVEQTYRVDVLLQQIVATVTDAEGRFVSNLRPEDFIIEVDGVPQTIAHFTQDAETPISLGFVIDTSKSMKFATPAAIDSATAFVNEMHSVDEAFLMTFDTSSHLRQDMTQNMRQMVGALDKVRAASTAGGTNVIMSVVNAANQSARGKNRKKAVILISDGVDTAHSMEVPKFISAIRASELVDYAIQIEAPKVQPSFDPHNTPCKEPTVIAAPSEPARGPTTQGPPSQEEACRQYLATLERSINMYWDWIDRALQFFNWDLSHWTAQELNAYKYDLNHYSTGLNPVEDKLAELMMQGIAAGSGGNYFLVDAKGSPNALSQRLTSVTREILTELRSQYTLGIYPPSGITSLSRVRIRMVNPTYKVRTRFGSGEMRSPERD